MKQRQQRELAESIIAKVKKELENPKALQQILQQSIADVESECFPRVLKFSNLSGTNTFIGIVSSKTQ